MKAVILLPFFRAGLHLAGLRRLQGWLDRATLPAGAPLSLEEAKDMGNLVNIASRHTLGPVTCLTRSLLLDWMLHRRGVASQLRIGVRITQGAFDAHAWVEAAASRLFSVQGNYLQVVGDSSKLRAGVRYREAYRVGPWIPGELDWTRYLDLWSRGETELDSALVVQYGLFTTTHDGAVSFSPKGGLLVRLNPHWQASLAATRRFVDGEEDPLRTDFTPLLLADTLDCEHVDTTCYEAQVLRGEGEDSTLRVRASFREFDRTVRLFVRDDFGLGL